MKTKNKELKLINKAAFDKLTKLEKRVVMCEDVIMRIKSKNIKPVHGAYVKNSYDIGYKLEDDTENSEKLKEVLNTEKCEGCAKGSMLLCQIANFNSVTPESFNNMIDDGASFNDYMPPPLRNTFGKVLLDAMEVAFEGEVYSEWTSTQFCNIKYGEPTEKGQAIIDYFKKGNRGAEKKLIFILQNIIDNKGKLVGPGFSVG